MDDPDRAPRFARAVAELGARGWMCDLDDSSPVLADRRGFAAWASTMQKDYQKLCRDVRSGSRTLLDEYGATNPAEFFAVATEYFFERSKELQRIHPQLYGELKRFYNQDPAAFATGGGPQ